MPWLRAGFRQNAELAVSSTTEAKPMSVAQNTERMLKSLVRKARVVLVGLGNIGSRMAMELPLAGAKELLLVDPDRTSARNLRTCWAFSPKDIGQPKVDVVARQVRRSFPEVAVETAPCSFNRLGLARLHDWLPAVLVGAVDSRRARYELAEAAFWMDMPLFDLGIPAAGPPAARAQLTWRTIRAIDPLKAWSAQDWDLLEQTQPCGLPSSDRQHKPVASSASGAAAATLGVAAVRKLLSGDTSDIGWELRLEMTHFSTARRALPSNGFSPLDPSDAIRARPLTCKTATLGNLVDAAERLLGSGAVLLLNREISFGFLCRRCGYRPEVGPVGWQPCPRCGRDMIPVHPLTRLCRDSIQHGADEPVGCLGMARDLLRVQGSTERGRVWMEYRTVRRHHERPTTTSCPGGLPGSAAVGCRGI